MADKVWKVAERRVADLFGTTRTPLSGGNGKVTRSDTLHDSLFIECKYWTKFALVDLFCETAGLAAKEKKFPILVLVEKRRKLTFAVVPLKKKYLLRLFDELIEDDAVLDDGPGVLQISPKEVKNA